ncbi:sensor histidine kinase [Cumulibacter soli]|uniref:sensor histidine kinase n=1 Tax=Cumulibacter soli TaxID=2546344 RepID=UPI001067298F|nr:histidine kinase [Cumulibacter soli]
MADRKVPLFSWSRRTSVTKFEDYTAWSLYLLACLAPLILAQWHAEMVRANATLTAVFWVLVLAQVVLAVVAIRGRVRALREQRPDAGKLGILVLVLGALTLAVVYAVLPDGTGESGEPQMWIPVLVGGYAIAVASIGASKRRLIVQTLISYVAIVGVILAFGVPGPQIPARVFSTAIFVLALIVSVRASFAMLSLMYEVDRSRDVASQLAVAEERLRFARDLHDTLGRNLSAIALKSQVAGRLANRDVPASVREMDAVRQLAGDSLSEMRAVVRGYRAVDLAAELRGAQSLLRAASIEPRIELDAADIPIALREGVGWVVREGVTNVIRHSNAAHCWITAQREDAVLVVRLSNDRAVPGSGSVRGSGLNGLAERIAPLGGVMSVSREGDTFVLTVSFEVDRSGDDQNFRAGALGNGARDIERVRAS